MGEKHEKIYYRKKYLVKMLEFFFFLFFFFSDKWNNFECKQTTPKAEEKHGGKNNFYFRTVYLVLSFLVNNILYEIPSLRKNHKKK